MLRRFLNGWQLWDDKSRHLGRGVDYSDEEETRSLRRSQHKYNNHGNLLLSPYFYRPQHYYWQEDHKEVSKEINATCC